MDPDAADAMEDATDADATDATDAMDATDTAEPPPPFEEVFNPNEIYLIGNLVTDSTDRRAMIDLGSPLSVGAGFPAELADPNIDPITRQLRYRAGGELRTFACDVCPAARDTFVDNPAGNDLTTIPCDGFSAFWINPEGTYLYQCASGYRTTTEVSTVSGQVQTFGSSANVLVLDDETLSVQRIDSVAIVNILQYVPGCELIASRAQPTGFLAAVECSGVRALWDITFAGLAEERFVYSSLPDGFTFDGENAALDERGNLFLVGGGPAGDEVVELDGASAEIAYTETDDSLLQIHESFLVTGP